MSQQSVTARLYCSRCGSDTPSSVILTEPGWVIARCHCGGTQEITTAEVVAMRRLTMLKAAEMPTAPPLGIAARPAETGAARLRNIAYDLWRRGAITDEAYQNALARLDG